MDIRIHQQFAQIGLRIQHPVLRLDISRPVLDLSISEPRLHIHSELPRIQIDQTECFADMGKQTPLQFSRSQSQAAREEGLEATGQIVAEGDMLGAIEDGVTVADIALMNTEESVDFNVDCIPKHRPRIEVITYPVEFSFDRGKVDANLIRGDVKLDLDWGKVRVYLRQQPRLEIEYVGRHYNTVA